MITTSEFFEVFTNVTGIVGWVILIPSLISLISTLVQWNKSGFKEDSIAKKAYDLKNGDRDSTKKYLTYMYSTLIISSLVCIYIGYSYILQIR